MDRVENDLGVLRPSGPDGVATDEIDVYNDGTKHLFISELVAGCSCTSASVSNNWIPPSGRAKLVARIKVGDAQDTRFTRVSIKSSDDRRPSKQIVFKWEAFTPIRTEPPSLEFGRLDPGQGARTSVDLLGVGLHLCGDCTIRADASSKLIRCDLEEKDARLDTHGTRSDGPERRRLAVLRVQALPYDDPGFYSHTITARLTCKGQELGRVIMPVVWRIGQLLEVSPSRVSFGTCPPDTWVSARIVVNSLKNEKFKIQAVSCEDAKVEMKFERIAESGSASVLDVRMLMPKSAGPWASKLNLETDLVAAKHLTVPISAIVRDATPGM